MLKSLKSEDWVATIIGAVVLLLVILLPSVLKNHAYMSVIVALLTYLGYLFMGKKDNGRFLLSFAIVYLLAWLATYISGLTPVKGMGFESVFFAVIIGLLIRNTVGLPSWMAPAVMSEYYIKAGLVILGSSILFNEIMNSRCTGRSGNCGHVGLVFQLQDCRQGI